MSQQSCRACVILESLICWKPYGFLNCTGQFQTPGPYLLHKISALGTRIEASQRATHRQVFIFLCISGLEPSVIEGEEQPLYSFKYFERAFACFTLQSLLLLFSCVSTKLVYVVQTKGLLQQVLASIPPIRVMS